MENCYFSTTLHCTHLIVKKLSITLLRENDAQQPKEVKKLQLEIAQRKFEHITDELMLEDGDEQEHKKEEWEKEDDGDCRDCDEPLPQCLAKPFEATDLPLVCPHDFAELEAFSPISQFDREERHLSLVGEVVRVSGQLKRGIGLRGEKDAMNLQSGRPKLLNDLVVLCFLVLLDTCIVAALHVNKQI